MEYKKVDFFQVFFSSHLQQLLNLKFEIFITMKNRFFHKLAKQPVLKNVFLLIASDSILNFNALSNNFEAIANEITFNQDYL